MIYDGEWSDFPHKVVAIIQSLSLSENRKSRESQRNKDVSTVRRRVRHVKCGTPITLIRNTDAIETQHETVTMCIYLLASQS